MYFVLYCKCATFLLLHGNGADIKAMSHQIDYFKSKYKIIVADSRGHGKSELKTDSLTYNQITRDWEELSNHLNLDSVIVLGWSDGGIFGLKMGIGSNSTSSSNLILEMGEPGFRISTWTTFQQMNIGSFLMAWSICNKRT